MLDKSFVKWFAARVLPFTDVPPEKLAAEREAIAQQQEYNQNYADFLNGAVLPGRRWAGADADKSRIVHRVSSWGNQLSLRVHLAWRWGELVIMQSHEDAVTFEHHIITEGEKRGDDSARRPHAPIRPSRSAARSGGGNRNCNSSSAGSRRTWSRRTRARNPPRRRSSQAVVPSVSVTSPRFRVPRTWGESPERPRYPVRLRPRAPVPACRLTMASPAPSSPAGVPGMWPPTATRQLKPQRSQIPLC